MQMPYRSVSSHAPVRPRAGGCCRERANSVESSQVIAELDNFTSLAVDLKYVQTMPKKLRPRRRVGTPGLPERQRPLHPRLHRGPFDYGLWPCSSAEAQGGLDHITVGVSLRRATSKSARVSGVMLIWKPF
jgi:hypothetical protein